MKTSLRNKVLILSLAALVVAGSGCERRGRAVKKEAAPKENVTATGEKQTTVEQKKTDGTPTKPTVVVETSNEETQVFADSQLDCLPSLDVAATSSIESFVADLTMMNNLRACLEKHGVKIVQDTMTIDASATRDPNDPSKNSALLNEYDAIATTTGSDDEKAAKVMKSRLKVLELNSKKMLDKYTDARLKLETEYEYGQKTHTVGGTLANFAKVITACEEAAKLVDGYSTVKDGVDLTQVVKADESSEESEE